VRVYWFGAMALTTALLISGPCSAQMYVPLTGLDHQPGYNYVPSIAWDAVEGIWKSWRCSLSENPVPGHGDQHGDAIRYAESSNGVNWSGDREVFRSDGLATEGVHTCDPSVLLDPGYPFAQGGYNAVMWYMSGDQWTPTTAVSVAGSYDRGRTWVRLSYWNPVLRCGKNAQFPYGCGQFSVVKVGSEYWITFASVTSEYDVDRRTVLGHAGTALAQSTWWRSYDGLHPIEEGPLCIDGNCNFAAGADIMGDGGPGIWVVFTSDIGGQGLRNRLYHAYQFGAYSALPVVGPMNSTFNVSLVSVFAPPGTDPSNTASGADGAGFYRSETGSTPGFIASAYGYPGDPHYGPTMLEGVDWFGAITGSTLAPTDTPPVVVKSPTLPVLRPWRRTR
jgi:hypothetical protein